MKTLSEEDIIKWVVRVLDNRGYYGRRPINLDDLSRRSHGKYGISTQYLRKVLKKMVREEILLSKPGNFGPRYSLNPHEKGKIEEIVGRKRHF